MQNASVLGIIPAAIVVATCLAACDGPSPQPARADLSLLLDKLRKEHDIPGAVLAVRYADGEVEVFASGMTRLDDGRTVDPDDCFYIGSITKTYTAAVVLQLVDEGKLSLDDTLSKYMPAVPRAERMTIRQLLNHTTGMGDIYLNVYYLPLQEMLDQLANEWTPDELVRAGTELPTTFEPGTNWAYCDTAYDVLGRVVEIVTGNPLHDEYQTRLWEPLGLESSWLAGREPPRTDTLVTGHLAPTDFWPNSRELFPKLAPSTSIDEPVFAWAGGAIVSNTREMVTFMDALLGGRIVSRESLDAMFSFVDNDDGRPLTDPTKTGYGLGVITRHRGSHRRVGHGGMYSGFTAGLWSVEGEDMIVALLLNRGLYFDEFKILDAVIEAASASDTVRGTVDSKPRTPQRRAPG